MTLSTRSEFLFFITVIAWLTTSVWLYPLPRIGSATDVADWLVWCAGFVVIVLGLVSTVSIYRRRGRINFALFSLAVVLFLFLLTLGSDGVVYSFVFDKIFIHNSSLSWGLILGGGHGLTGIVQTLVCGFFTPIIFLCFWLVNFFQISRREPSQQ